MGIKEVSEHIAKNWPLLIAIIITLTPCIWGLSSVYYSGQIRTLHEQVTLLRIQNDFMEKRLISIGKVEIDVPADIKINQFKNLDSLRYPPITNPEKLSKDDIRNLADFYDLTKRWKSNPHLKMQDGDISYWYDQGLSENEIKLEFESRRIVLERADENHEVIDSQGDLSHLAKKIRSLIVTK